MENDRDFTNSRESLGMRLLTLQPVELLRAEYGETGVGRNLLRRIVRHNPHDDVVENFFRNFGYCKQHVYILRHNTPLTNVPKGFLTDKIRHHNIARDQSSRYESEYLIEMNYQFLEVVNNSNSDKFLKHYWPVKIVLTPNMIQVRVVIMEKSMRNSSNLIFRGRDLEEERIVSQVCSNTNVTEPNRVVDLTRGIKYLWENNDIDSLKVEHKNSSSVDTARMDTGLTYKQSYPEEYERIKTQPLKKMFFQGLNPQLPLKFTCDPEYGYLGVMTYQSDNEFVDRLIDQIIAHN